MKNTIEKALQKKREQEKNDKTSSHQALVTNNKSQDALTEPSPSCEPVVSNGHFEKETFELDLVRLEEKGHISLTGSRTLINEEFREIKRKLIKKRKRRVAFPLFTKRLYCLLYGFS